MTIEKKRNENASGAKRSVLQMDKYPVAKL